jgi:hypothetical protein
MDSQNCDVLAGEGGAEIRSTALNHNIFTAIASIPLNRDSGFQLQRKDLASFGAVGALNQHNHRVGLGCFESLRNGFEGSPLTAIAHCVIACDWINVEQV